MTTVCIFHEGRDRRGGANATGDKAEIPGTGRLQESLPSAEVGKVMQEHRGKAETMTETWSAK